MRSISIGMASRFHARASALALAIGVAAQLPALAATPAPSDAHAFHISQGTLDAALRQFATQSHMQVLYDPALVQNLHASAFNGTVSAEKALQALLKGTGLVYDFTDGSTIAIKAGAAQGSSQKAPPAAKPASTQLESIVVTATKRQESVESIPASIVAISGSELEQRGAQGIVDIAELVPGVNVSMQDGTTSRITIRGITNDGDTNATTGVLFDDISFNDAYVPHVMLDPNPFDMENVEVLKGPQGTLFGASALNGAIRYVPEQPEFGVFDGKYYAEYGQVSAGDQAWSGGAMVNVPLTSDTLALRVVAYDSGLPGWIDNILNRDKDANRGHQSGQRAILAWKPNDDFQASLTYASQRTTRHDEADADNENGLLQTQDRLRASPWSSQYDLTSLKLQYDFGAFNFVSDSGYVWKQFIENAEASGHVVPGGGLPILLQDTYDHSTSFSQEFRLVSKDDADSPGKWVAGVFASHQSVSQYGAFPLGDPSLSLAETAGLVDAALGAGAGQAWIELGQPAYQIANVDVTVKELAAFFDVSRKFGDWEASFGGRLYDTSSGGTVDNGGLLLDLTGFPNGQHLDKTVKQHGFNPKASLQWHLNDDVMLYGLVSKGYRVGGVQWGNSGFFASEPAPSLFKTDTIWNYEIGLRSKWLDNRLQFDATAFYERWKNPQVLVFVSNGLGAYIDNVGGVISKGFETSLAYLFSSVPGLKFRISGTYDRARTTTDFITAVESELVPKGSEWPLSPKWQGSATLDYQHSMGNWYWGGFLTDAYVGRATFGVGQSDTVFNYNQINAQVRIGLPTLPTAPELALTLDNAFDKRAINASYSGEVVAGVPWHEVTYIQPRTWMLRLSGSF
ncbi:MAG: TonB-dependent receptor [Rudaea sp.]|uniref:TonB-dependent receptor domain-containing protein n=1 Tax=Rudaea sp. TaxID=2136325 RepID=UPI0039E2F486